MTYASRHQRSTVPIRESANVPPPSAELRTQLSFRIRTVAPQDWSAFSQLWMAFNALYGGEPDRRERARVMASVRRYFGERAALRVLRAVTKPVDRILEIPPADMLLNRWDPNFRAASQRCAGLYRNSKESSVGRLAAVAGVLYQIRCNLLHGSKDPRNERDLMLVRESVSVLRELVPALEAAMNKRAA